MNNFSKGILVGLVIGVLTFLWYQFANDEPIDYKSKYEEYKVRKEEALLLIAEKDSIIDSLRLQRGKDIITRDSLVIELDSAYIRIEDLAKIEVTNEDKIEALEWIKLHNSSLDQ